MENEGTRVVFSHYKSMGIFPNPQGQLTHKSFVGYCQISNPSRTLWLSSSTARIKKNQSKMKELEWSQDFPHYSPMGAICCHGNQSSDPILPKPYYIQSPTPMMLQMTFTIGQLVSEIFMFESVNTRTDGCQLESHLISLQRAFRSGELKKSMPYTSVFYIFSGYSKQPSH